MVWSGLVWAFSACALVGACGKTSDSDRAPSDRATSADADAAELEAWERAYAEALCAQDRDCPTLAPKMYVSFDACMDDKFYKLQAFFQYYGGVEHFAERASVYRIGSAVARERCLAGLLMCESSNEAGCEEVLLVRSPGKQGDACAAGPLRTPRPCGDGLFCSSFTCDCQPLATPGEPCETRQCTADHYCRQTYVIVGDVVQEGPGYCTAVREVGESCGDLACRPGLVCDDGECRELSHPNEACQSTYDCPVFYTCDQNRCVREPDRRGVGEACPRGAGCAYPLLCVSEVCTELLPDGAPCQRSTRTRTSGCQHWCAFDSPDASAGTCKSSPPTLAPTPCTIYRGDSRMQCPAGSHPDTRGDAAVYPEFPAYCQCEPGAEASGAVCE